VIIKSLATAKKFLSALSPSPSTREAQAEAKAETTSLGLAATACLADGIKADEVVVNKDGSGSFTAIAVMSTNSKRRYVINIKAEAYMENLEVGEAREADSIGKTIIKASRNDIDGSTTSAPPQSVSAPSLDYIMNALLPHCLVRALMQFVHTDFQHNLKCTVHTKN
jgi:pectinesterase